MNEKGELFLELYRELESVARKSFFPEAPESEGIIGRVMSLPQLRPQREAIDYCRVVRNFLVHNPKVDGVYPITPSDEMIELLRKCVYSLKHPDLALPHSIKRKNLYFTTPETKVMDLIEIMNKRGFTHIPVIDKGEFVGVFSDNVIYSYLCNEGELHINESTRISQFSNYYHIFGHLNEYFEFVPEDISFHEVSRLFNKNSFSKKQLAAIFITEHGKPSENILGMLTPWSVIEESISITEKSSPASDTQR